MAEKNYKGAFHGINNVKAINKAGRDLLRNRLEKLGITRPKTENMKLGTMRKKLRTSLKIYKKKKTTKKKSTKKKKVTKKKVTKKKVTKKKTTKKKATKKKATKKKTTKKKTTKKKTTKKKATKKKKTTKKKTTKKKATKKNTSQLTRNQLQTLCALTGPTIDALAIGPVRTRLKYLGLDTSGNVEELRNRLARATGNAVKKAPKKASKKKKAPQKASKQKSKKITKTPSDDEYTFVRPKDPSQRLDPCTNLSKSKCDSNKNCMSRVSNGKHTCRNKIWGEKIPELPWMKAKKKAVKKDQKKKN